MATQREIEKQRQMVDKQVEYLATIPEGSRDYEQYAKLVALSKRILADMEAEYEAEHEQKS